jgi:hypothetical protein
MDGDHLGAGAESDSGEGDEYSELDEEARRKKNEEKSVGKFMDFIRKHKWVFLVAFFVFVTFGFFLVDSAFANKEKKTVKVKYRGNGEKNRKMRVGEDGILVPEGSTKVVRRQRSSVSQRLLNRGRSRGNVNRQSTGTSGTEGTEAQLASERSEVERKHAERDPSLRLSMREDELT